MTFVSSYSHTRHSLERYPISENQSILEYYDNKLKFRMLRYQDSKLMLNAFVERLATIVSSDEVIVNSVCPGVLATNFNRNLPCWIKPLVYVYCKVKERSVLEGGRLLIHATVVSREDSHGRFLQNGQIHRYVAPCLVQCLRC